jgi:galactokinase
MCCWPLYIRRMVRCTRNIWTVLIIKLSLYDFFYLPRSKNISGRIFLYKRSDHAVGLHSERNMTEKENDFTVEQIAYTKIRTWLGYLATDIKHDLD